MKTCLSSISAIALLATAPASLALPQVNELTGEASAGPMAHFGQRPSASATEARAILSGLPLTFLENVGQWDSPARFAARRGPVTVAVEPHALTVTVERDGGFSTTGFHFEGAREDVVLEPLDPTPGLINMYSGSDRERWAEGLVAHERLAFRGLYDGIDVLLRTQDGHVEYDVLLAAGASLAPFTVRCDGVTGLSIDEEGGLLLETTDGVLRQSAPVTWAEMPDGTHEPIACRFVVVDETHYGFELPDRPAGHAVVIDPGLEWSTYLGGFGNDSFVAATRDSAGRLVAAGLTGSSGWALPGGVLATNGDLDCFIAVLDPTQPAASQVVWWTNFGGATREFIWDVAVNAADEVFVCGSTESANFPTTPGAFNATLKGVSDGFVARVAPGTGTLLYSSYVGGALEDRIHRLLLQEPATVTLGGTTLSPDLPTTPNAHDTTRNGRDYFLSVFDLNQSGPAALQYMSYFGGSHLDGWLTERQMDIAFTPGGELILCGSTRSSDLPSGAASFSPNLVGGQDAFVSIIDLTVPGPAAVLYTAYLGSSGGDGGTNVAVDPTGGIIVTAFSYDAGFPTTSGAVNTAFKGPSGFNDAVLMKIDPSLPVASQFVYSTFVSGLGYEGFWDIKVSNNGTVFGSCFTGAQGLQLNDLPVTVGAYQETFAGETDGVLLALTPAGNGLDDLHYLTYLGGSAWGTTRDILADTTSGTPVVRGVGGTNSSDFPTTPGAYQAAIGAGIDGVAFQLRFNPYYVCVAGANSVSPNGARVSAGGSFTLADNALNLAVTNLPQNSVGYFLMSTTGVPAFALPPPSGGSLCLGGTIVRFAAFVQNSGTQGEVSFSPDLANIPPPGMPLIPGDTTHFQYWYRDVGSTSNTSNGVAITLD